MTNQGFKACLFHPNVGTEVVDGDVFVDRAKLRFQSRQFALEMPLESIVVGFDNSAGAPVRFSHPQHPGAALLTSDRSILSHPALVQSPHTRSQLRDLAWRGELRRRLKLVCCFFIGGALVWWLGSLALGAMVRSLVLQIPPKWEAKFGDEEMTRLQAKLTLLDDSNRVAQLTALAAPLMRTIPARAPFKFYIVDSYLPNAFAVPGGHVLVTRGLLETAERPEQLLAVIAHETAHLTLKHSFRQVISGLGPIYIIRIFLSDRNHRVNLLAELSGLLIYESYSREYEQEADEAGWNYLVAANIDPHGMLEMLYKLEQYERPWNPQLRALDSHPATRRRVKWMQDRWDKLPRKSGFLQITNELPFATS